MRATENLCVKINILSESKQRYVDYIFLSKSLRLFSEMNLRLPRRAFMHVITWLLLQSNVIGFILKRIFALSFMHVFSRLTSLITAVIDFIYSGAAALICCLAGYLVS